MRASEALPYDDLDGADLLYRLFVRLASICPICWDALHADFPEESLDHVVSHLVLASGPGSPHWVPDPADPGLPRASPSRQRIPFPRVSGVSRSIVARRLLERARSNLATDPSRAGHAAWLALRVLTPPRSPEESRLHLAAHLHRADALRAGGRVEEAGRILDRHLAEVLALDAPAWRGDLHLLAGTIRQAQERPDDALLHLRLARAAYRTLGDDGRLVRAVLRTASVLRSAGELTRAIAMASEALELAGSCPESSLRLAAHHNLAAYLIDAGLDVEARQVLAAVLDLYPTSADSPALLRYLWLSARLAASAGDRETAAATYRKVRDRLLARGETHEAALLTAELARLHLQASDPGRSEEALRALGPILRETPRTRESAELRQLLSCLEDDTALPPALVRELTELLEVRDP